MKQADSPQVLTVTETAKLLRLARNSVYAAIRRGEIPSRKIGRRLLVPREALERFLAAQTRQDLTPKKGL